MASTKWGDPLYPLVRVRHRLFNMAKTSDERAAPFALAQGQKLSVFIGVGPKGCQSGCSLPVYPEFCPPVAR